jgi:hypothetical protein
MSNVKLSGSAALKSLIDRRINTGQLRFLKLCGERHKREDGIAALAVAIAFFFLCERL